MKRVIFPVVFLFLVSSSYAANKMSMVTYFPVPYVAYSQVSADQQLDVGLTSTCNMNLGCSESDVNLKAHTVNLQKGKLELNNGKGVFGQSISLGNGNGSGQVRFNNVRMQGGEMQSLNAESMNVRSLELFGKPFPACKGKGESDGQMKWAELSLQGAAENTKELYLVCGDTKTVTCQPTDPRGATYTENCAGNSGQITYTWDYEWCEYIPSGECGKRKCLSAARTCEWTLIKCNLDNTPSGECNDLSSSLPSCNGIQAHDQVIGRYVWSFKEMKNKYKILDPSVWDGTNDTCKVNGECSSCVVGEKYTTDMSYIGDDIRAPYGASCRQQYDKYYAFAVQYAECVEVDAGESCPVASNESCVNKKYTGTSLPGGGGPATGWEVVD